MKHMFAGDPWYNGQGQQGGVQGMGFRPGPVQISMVKPPPMPAPTFGGIPQQTIAPQAQTPLLAQAAAQQRQAPPPPPAPGAGPQQRIPMGSKANCPVCRNFGG